MSDGTLQTLDVTMLDDVNNASGLIQLDSNAKIPACSGAALTNLPGVTKNASDPVVTTNPSGGVGSVWQNTTSGEMFICTDATAGSNVWTNIGAGSGDVEPATWYGSRGVFAGGGSFTAILYVTISTTSDAVTFGDLTSSRRYLGATSNGSRGVFLGGVQGVTVGTNWRGAIDYITISTLSNSSTFGDLTQYRNDGGATSGN